MIEGKLEKIRELKIKKKIKEEVGFIKPIKGVDYIDGKKGKDGKNGKDGKDGRDGKKGRNGKDGKDGKDGSPDNAKQIRDKIETLTGEDRLDAKAIKNIDKYAKNFFTSLASSNNSGGTNDHTQLINIGTNTHDQIDAHIANTSNPHSVTKSQVGLANVDNTSDANKPISTATQTALDGKSATTHNHNLNDLTEKSYNSLTDKPTLGTASALNTGTASGEIPTLDGSGKLSIGLLPGVALTDTFVVADQTAMLALTAQTGDVAVRSDINKTYILKGSDPTVLGDWQELLTPTDSVQSIFGRQGTVTAQTNDYTWAQINKATSSLGDLQTGGSTSSQLAGLISDETGSGSLVFANTPTLVTPILGVATATSLNISTTWDGSLRFTSTQNWSSWTPDVDTIGGIEFYGSDASGSGAGIRSYIKSFVTAVAGNGNRLEFGVSSSNNAAATTVMSLFGGKMGLGVLNPAVLFDAASDSQGTFKFTTANDTATTASQIQLVRTRGTVASQTIISDGDLLGSILFRGYNTAQVTSASIRAEADGEWGTAGDTSDQPGRIVFATVPNGSSTLVDRFYIKNSGLFGFNTSDPTKVVEINSSTGACLRLTYNDSDGSATNYADFSMSSGGDLTIAPSGGDTTITGNVTISQTDNTQQNPMVVYTRTASGGDYLTIADYRTGSSGGLRINKSSAGSTSISTWTVWDLTDDRWEAQGTTTVAATNLHILTSGVWRFDNTAYGAVTAGDALTFNPSLQIGYKKVGVNTTGADKALEINSEDGNNLRLTYNDADGSAVNYADFSMSSSGDLTITPSGGDVAIVGDLTISANDIITDTTTGMKIGTATGQKIGLWNATPIVQPTTAVAAATFVAGAGTAVNDASTFDGYTIKQVVKALRNLGALA